MDYSYEEMRSLAMNILAKRLPYNAGNQYGSLEDAITNAIKDSEKTEMKKHQGPENLMRTYHSDEGQLSKHNRDLFLEVFWGLFRDGIITLGSDYMNREFPFFKISESGKKILESGNVYFFHDVSTYEKLVKEQIPDMDETTLIYLKEAMQAFLSGCVLSSTVMLGVSIEDSFSRLLETIEKNGEYCDRFKNAVEETTLLRKFNKFNNVMQQISKSIPSNIKENMETDFSAVLNMIRNFRNESGHPSGKIITREQCYVLLQLFIPCCKKIYELIHFFAEKH